MKARAVLSTLALLGTTVVGAVVAPAAPALAATDPAPVTVAWPDVPAHINPTVTPFEFTVTDNPTGAHLFYTWGWQDYDASQVWWPGEPVPDSGKVAVDFTGREGHGAVRIWTCPTDAWTSDCVESARSPEIDAWYDLQVADVEGGSPPARRSGVVQHFPIWYAPQPSAAGTVPTATWELLGDDLQPLDPAVTGTFTQAELSATNPDNGFANVSFTLPDGLPSGTYYMNIHLSADTADFGHLEGDLGSDADGFGLKTIIVDNDAPTLTVRRTAPVLYPVTDQYLDVLPVYAKASEMGTVTLDVVNKAGTRVFHSPDHSVWSDDFNWYDAPVWNGRQGGKVVPEGVYTLELTAADRAGNTTVWKAPVTVSHKSLKWTIFKKTVTAADSVSGKPYVGKCATLAKPAKGGARGSLGFYSATKCHGTVASAGVATNHGMYIPKAFKNHWDYAQVTLNGGPATASKHNYIQLGYLRPGSNKVWNGRFFTDGKQGPHAGMRYPIGAKGVFDQHTDHPFILWTNGCTAGSRYDVNSYTVVVRYQALR